MRVATGPKRTDVRSVVEDALRDSDRRVRFSIHAQERLEERVHAHPHLSLRDVLRVLRKGTRDEERDEWNPVLERWSYCYTGRGVDGDRLRVAVALVEPGVLVVTIVRPGDPDE